MSESIPDVVVMFKRLTSLFFGTFVFGIPAGFIISVLILLVPFVAFDWLYDASLFIPSQLGLVDEIEAAEIVEVQGGAEQQIGLRQPGRYLIMATEKVAANFLVNIVAQDGGQPVDVGWLMPDRGARFAAASPQYHFELETAGDYIFSVTPLTDSAPALEIVHFTIIPDVRNQNATVAVVGGLVQLGLIFLGVRTASRSLDRKRRQAAADRRPGKDEEMAAFLDKKRRRNS
ncbi:MAG: hypothetical protein KDE34_17240 [Anaerolineales bacterium]|nr:hypothetical protein [Anaerolineales bacterium]